VITAVGSATSRPAKLTVVAVMGGARCSTTIRCRTLGRLAGTSAREGEGVAVCSFHTSGPAGWLPAGAR